MAMPIILVLIVLCPVVRVTSQDCQRRSLITFNAGLTPQVGQYESRKRLVPAAVMSTDADVMCLQEVWYENDVKNILDAAALKYPHSYSSIHHSPDNLRKPETGRIMRSWFQTFHRKMIPNPCASYKMASFGFCMLFQCYGKIGNDFMNCIATKCYSQYFSLPQNCLSCVLFSATSANNVFHKCISSSYEYNRLNTQGLLLLSRHRILSIKKARFIPGIKHLLPRGYLEVEVEDVGTVVCTHLTANLEGRPYIEQNLILKGYTSYEQQQREEISIISQRFANKEHILIGDLNTGPAIASRQIDGEFPKNFQLFVDNGYISPYVVGGGNCTFCADNPIVRSRNSIILDHVLVKRQVALGTKRILELHNGKIISDHYGVHVDICTK